MSARLTHGGLPAELTPSRFKQLIRKARLQLGLSKGAVRYLEFALEKTGRLPAQQNMRHLAFIG